MSLQPVHVFRTDERSKRRILAEVHPKLDIASKEHGNFVVQDGKIMTPRGEVIKKPDDWIKAELDKISDPILEQHGLKRTVKSPEPVKPEVKAEAKAEAPAPKRRGRPPKAKTENPVDKGTEKQAGPTQ